METFESILYEPRDTNDIAFDGGGNDAYSSSGGNIDSPSSGSGGTNASRSSTSGPTIL